MGHAENKLKWCLNKALKEGADHRGLIEVKPDNDKAQKHITKAGHNLKTMNYLIKGNFADWAISASFYAMYHCLLAILAKHGYESRNQECTFACVENLINEGKVDLDKTWLRRIADFDEKKIENEDVIKLREEFQYGIDTSVEDEKVKKLTDETKEFIELVRIALI